LDDLHGLVLAHFPHMTLHRALSFGLGLACLTTYKVNVAQAMYSDGPFLVVVQFSLVDGQEYDARKPLEECIRPEYNVRLPFCWQKLACCE
jgi:hypothetical protein